MIGLNGERNGEERKGRAKVEFVREGGGGNLGEEGWQNTRIRYFSLNQERINQPLLIVNTLKPFTLKAAD